MSKSETIIIRRWKPEDQNEIVKGLENWHWPYEPLSTGFRIKAPSPLEKQLFTSLPEKYGVTVVAVDPKEYNRIVGFLINSVSDPGYFNKMKSLLAGGNDERYENFLRIVQKIISEVNIFERYNVNKAFNFVALTVDPKKRGQNLGYRLFEYSMVLAKEMGYKLVSVGCSSYYSTDIAKRLNMQAIGTIAYKDYKDSEGNQIYQPTDPIHTNLTRFVKEI